MKIILAILSVIMLSTSYSQLNNLKYIDYTAKSKVIVDSLYSESLGEFRPHSIYLPKGFDNNNRYPIIYATDGGTGITALENVLDSLIENQVIKPVIFVASYSNNKIADSTSITYSDGSKARLGFRNFEYVDRSSSSKDTALTNRFQKHTNYFATELIPYVESFCNQNISKENRYFYGVSNGAGFGIHLLNTHPDLIGTYICLSTFGGDVDTKKWIKSVNYPKLYWRHGSEETFLQESAEFMKSKFEKLKLFIEVKEFQGGHNNLFWREELIEIISRVLK